MSKGAQVDNHSFSILMVGSSINMFCMGDLPTSPQVICKSHIPCTTGDNEWTLGPCFTATHWSNSLAWKKASKVEDGKNKTLHFWQLGPCFTGTHRSSWYTWKKTWKVEDGKNKPLHFWQVGPCFTATHWSSPYTWKKVSKVEDAKNKAS
jgi:hypothetical protein